MCVPFILCAPEPGSRNDHKLGKAVRQRGAPAQMFAQLSGRLADLGGSDQKLEGASEPPASTGGDLIITAPMGGRHLLECDFAIPGHLPSWLCQMCIPRDLFARRVGDLEAF